MFKYFKTKEFFLSLVLVVSVGALAYFYFFNFFLPSYTHHGESVIVPDVSKMSLEEAKAKLKEADLLAEIKDSIYMPNTTGSVVLKQFPGPSSTVKPERTVFLSISKSIPPNVKMPKLIDLSVYQAKSKLESWKLQVKEVRKVPDIARNVVLRVLLDGKDIKEGTEVPQGTGITLVIGQGENINRGYAKVPNVIGLRYEEAAPRISSAGLNLNAQYDDINGDGKAYKQSPTGDSLKRGQDVTVWFHALKPLK